MEVFQQPMRGWVPHPEEPNWEEYIDHRGHHIAIIQDFGYAAYTAALNAATGNWERHGPTQDRVAGKLWAERVAGIHPVKPGDERPPFYYTPEGK